MVCHLRTCIWSGVVVEIMKYVAVIHDDKTDQNEFSYFSHCFQENGKTFIESLAFLVVLMCSYYSEVPLRSKYILCDH